MHVQEQGKHEEEEEEEEDIIFVACDIIWESSSRPLASTQITPFLIYYTLL